MMAKVRRRSTSRDNSSLTALSIMANRILLYLVQGVQTCKAQEIRRAPSERLLPPLLVLIG
jgi:hypothetical protein